jgi:hypothetical protein
MNRAERNKFEKILTTFFNEIHKIYTDGNFREESFYPALKELIEDCSRFFQKETSVNVLVVPRKTEAGIPDFRVGKNGEIIGYVEAKPPDASIGEFEGSEQIKRYRASLPNLILTNFLEFRLYRSSHLINKVEVGRQFTLRSLKSPPSPEKLEIGRAHV